MKNLLRFLMPLALTLGFLGGCSNTPIAPSGSTFATGPNATVAEAYAAISEARAQATILVKADKMTSVEAESVRANLRTAQEAVDAARPLVGAAQVDKLTIATTAITAARAILTHYGASFK